MENKKLGVLGGMGSKATAVFFEKVISNTHSTNDQDHINMVILNDTNLPDRTKAILEKREQDFLKIVEQDLKIFEYAGVNNIAIPCNTAHYFYDQIQEKTDIHVINMIEETVKEIYNRYGKGAKVGILATTGTINSGIYQKECINYQLIPYVPTEEVKQIVMDVIYKDVKRDLNLDGSKIEAIVQQLIIKENCQCVILACTELSCLHLKEHVSKFCIDAMDVLIKTAIEKCGKRVKDLETVSN